MALVNSLRFSPTRALSVHKQTIIVVNKGYDNSFLLVFIDFLSSAHIFHFYAKSPEQFSTDFQDFPSFLSHRSRYVVCPMTLISADR